MACNHAKRYTLFAARYPTTEVYWAKHIQYCPSCRAIRIDNSNDGVITHGAWSYRNIFIGNGSMGLLEKLK